MERIGLIAGNGTFPLLFAREARARGFEVIAVAHRGETEERLAGEVDSITWVRVGQLGRMLRAFRRAGIERAVMAGGLDRRRSLTRLRPDLRGMLFLRRVALLRARGDDALLRALAAEFEAAGVEIVPSTLFLDRIVARPGMLAGPRPSEHALNDVRHGAAVLAALSPFDVGQSVVVENGVVLAIEAVEGTDEAIRRAGEHARGRAVVVKIAKRGQDMRFDVPAVGPGTIVMMAAHGATTLAVEAGATIILEDDRFFASAAEHRISCVGCTADGEVRS